MCYGLKCKQSSILVSMAMPFSFFLSHKITWSLLPCTGWMHVLHGEDWLLKYASRVHDDIFSAWSFPCLASMFLFVVPTHAHVYQSNKCYV